MTLIAYRYRVMRYVHDPAAGEALNVGVLLFAPDCAFLGFQFAATYGRLSDAFVGFDGNAYRRHIARTEGFLGRLSKDVQNRLNLFGVSDDFDTITRAAFPDLGAGFQAGPVFSGICNDPELEVDLVFERMVTSQFARPDRIRRSDEQVWNVYNTHLPLNVRERLTPNTFEMPDFEAKFQHTFKNELTHVLVPISMDYAEPDSMQRKAIDLLGKAVALRGHKDLGKMHLLLGLPKDNGLLGNYNRAKDLLRTRLEADKQIVEENEAPQFAIEIEHYMKKHGVIQ